MNCCNNSFVVLQSAFSESAAVQEKVNQSAKGGHYMPFLAKEK